MGARPKDRGTTVLLVEDEALVRMLEADLLEEQGYHVIEAANADEALRVLETDPDAVNVLFTDVRMPGSMDGLCLARTAHMRWPHLKLVVTSGHLRIDDRDLPDSGRFLPKPSEANALVRIMSEVMANPHHS